MGFQVVKSGHGDVRQPAFCDPFGVGKVKKGHVTRRSLRDPPATFHDLFEVEYTYLTNVITHSRCRVWGNRSKGWMSSSLKPCCCMMARSRTWVAGSHET